jgi:hypothetical protein
MSYFYYEVLDSHSNRICMCGSEADARMMMSLGPNRSWIKRQFLAPDTVNTTAEEVHQDHLPQRLELPQGNQVAIYLTK